MADRGQVDDDRDVLVPAAGVPRDGQVLAHAPPAPSAPHGGWAWPWARQPRPRPAATRLHLRTRTSSVVGRQPKGSCASRRATVPRATPSAPHRRHRIRLDHTALQHHPAGLNELPDGLKAKAIEPGQRGEVRADEGSVGHVGGSVGTSIIGRPRPLPRHRRAHPDYTPNCDEPAIFAELGLTPEQRQLAHTVVPCALRALDDRARQGAAPRA